MSWWLILIRNVWKKFHAYVKASLLSWNEYCSLEKCFFFRWKSSSFTYKGPPFELNNFFLGKDAFSDKNVPRLLFPLPWRQYLCLWKFYFQMKTFRVYLNRIPFEVIFFFLLFQMKHFKAYFGRLSPEMKKRLIGKVSFSDEKVPWLL